MVVGYHHFRKPPYLGRGVLSFQKHHQGAAAFVFFHQTFTFRFAKVSALGYATRLKAGPWTLEALFVFFFRDPLIMGKTGKSNKYNIIP